MPKYTTKCEPVDKKPYIVYSGEKDADISSGGGDIPSGGNGIEYIEADFVENKILASYNDIVNSINDGKMPVILMSAINPDTGIIDCSLQFISYAEGYDNAGTIEYRVGAFAVYDSNGEASVQLTVYKADDPNEDLKPTGAD